MVVERIAALLAEEKTITLGILYQRLRRVMMAGGGTKVGRLEKLLRDHLADEVTMREEKRGGYQITVVSVIPEKEHELAIRLDALRLQLYPQDAAAASSSMVADPALPVVVAPSALALASLPGAQQQAEAAAARCADAASEASYFTQRWLPEGML